MKLLELLFTLQGRVKGLINRHRLEQDLDDEMAFHLAMRAEQHTAKGLAPEEADLAAQRQFGNITFIKERCREAWTFNWLASLYADLRHAIRLMIKEPGFTVAAVLSLALGIGANTVMFSVFTTVFTKPLPWNDAGRITRISLRQKGDERFQYLVSPADRTVFDALRKGCRFFSNVAAVSLAQTGLSLTGLGEAEHYDGSAVSSNFFELLGVAPALGRTFFPEEDETGRANVAVLSDAFWQKRFNRDPNVIGRTLMLNGQAHTVIGVMPAGFKVPEWYMQKNADMWLPLDRSKDLGGRFMGVLGRMKPGVTLHQAEEEASGIAAGFDSKLRCGMALLTADYDGMKPRIRLLFAAVVLVLLVACANVANMVLARSTTRTRELGIRAAIGAGGLRIARQLFIEGSVFAAVASVLALLMGQAAIALLRRLKPAALPRIDEMSLDWNLFGFTLLLSIAVAVVIGVLPALRIARSQVTLMLRAGSDRVSESGLVLRGRESLIAIQVTLSVVLLIGAGLLGRSLLALSEVELGFDPRHALIFNLKTPEQWRPAQTSRFFSQVRERVGAIPGVEAVGYTNFGAPLEGTGSLELTVTGSRTAPGRPILTQDRGVSPGYFRAFGIPVLKGTEFADQQLVASDNVVIVNETFANRHWPGEDPVGKTIFASGGGSNAMRIIGVVKDVKEFNRTRLPDQEIYFPNPGSAMEILVGVRTTGDPIRFWPTVRSTVMSIDPNIPPYQVRRLEQVVSADLSAQKFLAGFLGLFASIAACLAAIGLYGVVSYAASRRTKEIGIRVALGASRWSILRALGGRYLAISGVGLLAGMAGGSLAARLIRQFLFQVEPDDPGNRAAVAALLILVTGLAAWLPVRRAASSDPFYALKCE